MVKLRNRKYTYAALIVVLAVFCVSFFFQGNSITGQVVAGARTPTVKTANYNYGTQTLTLDMRGVPGDSIDVTGNVIRVNGNIIKDKSGNPYTLDEKSYNLLSLYIKDYKGVIPNNTYLLLNPDANSNMDARRFGLVDKSGITFL